MTNCKHCKQPTTNAKAVCNLCLKDMKSGKPAGTTAKARGLCK